MTYIRYDNAVKELYNNLKEFIGKYINTEHNIIMFGTSQIVGMIIAYLYEHNMQVDYIIDNAKLKQGKKAYGLNIYSPEKVYKEFNEKNLIIIASGFQEEMIGQLEQMGYQKEKQIISIIDLPSLMNNYNFVNRTIMTELSSDEIKNEMFRVLLKLKEICEKNNLKYYLFGGTLLGAVRHKGFIPWDDDIDVLMEIKDMKKLADILKKDENFSMVCSFDSTVDYYEEMAIMFSKRYIADYNHFPMQYSAGISIDIFPIFGIPNTMDKIELFMEGFKELEMKKWNCLYDRKKCQQMSNNIYQYLCQYDFYKSDYVASSSNHYIKTIVPQEFYLNSLLYEFEGFQFMGPSNYDYVLNRIYGDYMKLPPVDQRVGWHTFKAYK